jgi:hypothetical protein
MPRRPRLSPTLAVLAALAVLAILPLDALATDAAAFQEATAAFDRASAGEPGAIARAKSLLDALAAASPDDPVVLAYAGSVDTMRARETRWPLRKLRFVDDGLDRIDQAVRRLRPEHDAPLPGRLPPRMETLLVAASTFLGVPDSTFHRAQDARGLLDRALAHSSFARLPPSVQAEFQWLSAEAARLEKRPEVEQAALAQVLALAPEGKRAAPARARLAEVRP